MGDPIDLMIHKSSQESIGVSSSQIRAARALLGWSGKDLAEFCSVGLATIRRYEQENGLKKANPSVLKAIINLFESHGIEFLGDPLVNPGVILHLDRQAK
ncbi:helix-turn-helix protein [Mariprofundus aestuarium]|uniref:Helix-turn-helix protein n=1 Tax=Mariprofundus aestuarium TaxID=1921086 RepID=A0A2K8L0E5_MARES|nr:helix-turn-helix transcriptional regulator [Mariprofundus aestuarium]ATX79669.1 helix-turn-helix protein [Mariprofundus aestuarium]